MRELGALGKCVVNTDQFGLHKSWDPAITLDLAGYPNPVPGKIPYLSYLYIYAFNFLYNFY